MFNPYVGLTTYVGYGAYAAADQYSSYQDGGYYDANSNQGTGYEYDNSGAGTYQGGGDPSMGMYNDPSMYNGGADSSGYGAGYGDGYGSGYGQDASSWGGRVDYSMHAPQAYGTEYAADYSADPTMYSHAPANVMSATVSARPKALQILDPSAVPPKPAPSKPPAPAASSSSSKVASAASTAAARTTIIPAPSHSGPILSGRAREEQLMSIGSIATLSSLAPYWVVMLNFPGNSSGGRGPPQTLVTASELVELRRQRKLQVGWLVGWCCVM